MTRPPCTAGPWKPQTRGRGISKGEQAAITSLCSVSGPGLICQRSRAALGRQPPLVGSSQHCAPLVGVEPWTWRQPRNLSFYYKDESVMLWSFGYCYSLSSDGRRWNRKSDLHFCPSFYQHSLGARRLGAKSQEGEPGFRNLMTKEAKNRAGSTH